MLETKEFFINIVLIFALGSRYAIAFISFDQFVVDIYDPAATAGPNRCATDLAGCFGEDFGLRAWRFRRHGPYEADRFTARPRVGQSLAVDAPEHPSPIYWTMPSGSRRSSTISALL